MKRFLLPAIFLLTVSLGFAQYRAPNFNLRITALENETNALIASLTNKVSKTGDTMNGNYFINGNITVSGTGVISTLYTTNLFVTNIFTVYSNMVVQHDANIGGDLTVSNRFILQEGQKQFKIENSTADQISIGGIVRGTNANIIGYQAMGGFPNDVIGKQGIVAMGYQAGYAVTNSPYSAFLGYQAGYGASNSPYSLMDGYQAGFNAYNSQDAVLSGYGAGYSAHDSSFIVAAGFLAGINANNSSFAVLNGYEAGYNASSSGYLFAQGFMAGFNAYNSSRAIMLGYEAGQNSSNSPDSIFIGDSAGADVSRSNTLVIDSNTGYSRTTNALIYGEFDNRLVRINGSLAVTNTMTVLGTIVLGTNAPITNWVGGAGTITNLISSDNSVSVLNSGGPQPNLSITNYASLNNVLNIGGAWATNANGIGMAIGSSDLTKGKLYLNGEGGQYTNKPILTINRTTTATGPCISFQRAGVEIAFVSNGTYNGSFPFITNQFPMAAGTNIYFSVAGGTGFVNTASDVTIPTNNAFYFGAYARMSITTNGLVAIQYLMGGTWSNATTFTKP